MRVVVLGLDDSGKTSILFRLKQNEFIESTPTIGFNVEPVEYKNLRFTVWDVGGLPKLRQVFSLLSHLISNPTGFIPCHCCHGHSGITFYSEYHQGKYWYLTAIAY